MSNVQRSNSLKNVITAKERSMSVDSSDTRRTSARVSDDIKPILKRKSLDECEFKTLPSILKKKDNYHHHNTFKAKTPPILKRHSIGSDGDHRAPIVALSAAQRSPNVHPILKHRSFEEQCSANREEFSLPKPILKKKWSDECIGISLSDGNGKTKSILKTAPDNAKRIVSINAPHEVKGILKSGPSSNTKPVKSALKKCDSNKGEVKSILKPEVSHSDTDVLSLSSSSSSASSSSSSSSSPSLSDIEIDDCAVSTSKDNDSVKRKQIQYHNHIDSNDCSSFGSFEMLQELKIDDISPKGEPKSDDSVLKCHKRLNKDPLNDRDTLKVCEHFSEGTGLVKSATQPIPTQRSVTKRPENSPNDSITQRLAQLKRNGEDGWKQRMSKIEDTVELRVPSNSRSGLRPTSIADRLSLLEESSTKWKNRVGEKDAIQFTVAGKMGQNEIPIIRTPERERRTPRTVPLKSQTTSDMPKLMQNTPEFLMRTPTNHALTDNVKPNVKLESNNSGNIIKIPKSDDETFTSFYALSSPKISQKQTILNERSFDCIAKTKPNLLGHKKHIKLQNRRSAKRNPIKQLALRTDFVSDHYVETVPLNNQQKTNVPTIEMNKPSGFALSALAGLASREDFKAVAGKLKSAASPMSPAKSFNRNVLIQVKGRRHAQTRIVEPIVTSVNSGDSYILVTKEQIFVWIGEFSNVIERTKSLEIGNLIHDKKELGFQSSNDVIVIDNQEKCSFNAKNNKLFLEKLSPNNAKDLNVLSPSDPSEDEYYETDIIETNIVYIIRNNHLTPFHDYWGQLPRYEMLSPNNILVFDFGSEMYCWYGKNVTVPQRKSSTLLAQELWDRGYDYSECKINPLGKSVALQSPKRPIWAMFVRVSQNMESVLFKDKFIDWPHSNNLIKPEIVKQKVVDIDTGNILNLSPINGKSLIETEVTEPDMVLENAHLGRGLEWHDECERIHTSITTLDVKRWRGDEERNDSSDEIIGHFYSGDTYIVRWNYRVSRDGRDFRTGTPSRHSFIGRDRICYFFWHGNDSTITDKGASALKTIELDNERAQQVRVTHGKESPAFLNLFKGSMIIFNGKKNENIKNGCTKRMFYIRGAFPRESCLIEVECKAQSLRSRMSFLFVNCAKNRIYIWHGTKSLPHIREAISLAVENLLKVKTSEFGPLFNGKCQIIELDEGKETKEFCKEMDISVKKDQRPHFSLIDNPNPFKHTPRLFYFSSLSGNFDATEMLCPYRSINHTVPYPFVQEDIYSHQQPSFFLFDNDKEMYLWESKYPFPENVEDEENANVLTGSSEIRWNAERKCALQTALAYCHAKNPGDPPKAYVVLAGIEPNSFIYLFPEWTHREEIARLYIKDGRKRGEMTLVEEVLTDVFRSSYKLSELRTRPLPEGVNPLCLESYLSDEDFMDAFEMTREEFYSLGIWKQRSLKQKAELF